MFRDNVNNTVKIYRRLSIDIPNGGAISPPIDFRWFTAAIVTVPSAWTAANLGFQVCDTENGTYVILRDDAGTPIQISNILTTGSRAYRLPIEIFASGFIRLWSKSTTAATESDVNQAALRTMLIQLKG